MKSFAVLSIAFLAFIPAFLAATLEDSPLEETEAIVSRERRAPCPTIWFPCSQMPNVCANMKNAQRLGKPATLNRITDKKQIARNRRASGCPKLPRVPGENCDEYPFASSMQGGKGAVIKSVPVRENSKQGGLLNAFYRKFSIGAGDCYIVNFGP